MQSKVFEFNDAIYDIDVWMFSLSWFGNDVDLVDILKTQDFKELDS